MGRPADIISLLQLKLGVSARLALSGAMHASIRHSAQLAGTANTSMQTISALQNVRMGALALVSQVELVVHLIAPNARMQQRAAYVRRANTSLLGAVSMYVQGECG